MQSLKSGQKVRDYCLIHRGTGSVLKETVRNGKECSTEESKAKVGGKMFTYAVVGQRVECPGEEDVIKFSVVSITLPDLVDKNLEMAHAILSQNPLFANLSGNITSFNNENSLLGWFGASSASKLDKSHLELFSSMYNGVDDLVSASTKMIAEENLEEFRAKHLVRKEKVGALLEDARFILSNPTHGGAIAYRNSERFGESLFRMEWIYKGGELFTIGPPNTDYKFMKFDENIVDKAHDNGDSKFITALLQFIKASYDNGSKHIFALQVNNTATVSRCGALDTEALAKHGLLGSTSSTGYTNILYGIYYGGTNSGSNSGHTASDGSEGETGGACGGCGKKNPVGQAVCSCGSGTHKPATALN